MDMTGISCKEYNCGRCGKENRKRFTQIVCKHHAYLITFLTKIFWQIF